MPLLLFSSDLLSKHQHLNQGHKLVSLSATARGGVEIRSTETVGDGKSEDGFEENILDELLRGSIEGDSSILGCCKTVLKLPEEHELGKRVAGLIEATLMTLALTPVPL